MSAETFAISRPRFASQAAGLGQTCRVQGNLLWCIRQGHPENFLEIPAARDFSSHVPDRRLPPNTLRHDRTAGWARGLCRGDVVGPRCEGLGGRKSGRSSPWAGKGGGSRTPCRRRPGRNPDTTRPYWMLRFRGTWTRRVAEHFRHYSICSCAPPRRRRPALRFAGADERSANAETPSGVMTGAHLVSRPGPAPRFAARRSDRAFRAFAMDGGGVAGALRHADSRPPRAGNARPGPLVGNVRHQLERGAGGR